MKIPNALEAAVLDVLSLARIVSEDSQLPLMQVATEPKSSKDS